MFPQQTAAIYICKYVHLVFVNPLFMYGVSKLNLTLLWSMYRQVITIRLCNFDSWAQMINNFSEPNVLISPGETYFATFYHNDCQCTDGNLGCFFEVVWRKTYLIFTGERERKRERNWTGERENFLYISKMKKIEKIKNKWQNMDS